MVSLILRFLDDPNIVFHPSCQTSLQNPPPYGYIWVQLENLRKCPLHLLTPISNGGFTYSPCGMHSLPSSPRFCFSETSCSPPACIPLLHPVLPAPPLSPCYTALSTLSESPGKIHHESPTSMLHPLPAVVCSWPTARYIYILVRHLI